MTGFKAYFASNIRSTFGRNSENWSRKQELKLPYYICIFRCVYYMNLIWHINQPLSWLSFTTVRNGLIQVMHTDPEWCGCKSSNGSFKALWSALFDMVQHLVFYWTWFEWTYTHLGWPCFLPNRTEYTIIWENCSWFSYNLPFSEWSYNISFVCDSLWSLYSLRYLDFSG